MTRKYDELIWYSSRLNDEQKNTLNEFYQQAFEILGIHYEKKPLLIKQLSIYIIRKVWPDLNILDIKKLIDDWFVYYETGFVSYKESFAQICDEFDLHLTYANKFIDEKAH